MTPLTRAQAIALRQLVAEWQMLGHGSRDALDPAQADVYFSCARDLDEALIQIGVVEGDDAGP